MLPHSIGTALATGQFSHVPVIIGTNHDEWRLFIGQDQLYGAPPVTAANYAPDISSTLSLPPSTASAIARQYPLSSYSSPAVALGAVGTDAIFACPALVAERDLSKYTPTYAYEFNDRPAPRRRVPGRQRRPVCFRRVGRTRPGRAYRDGNGRMPGSERGDPHRLEVPVSRAARGR